MKIDYSPRQSGKTTKLIEWLKKNKNGILLTSSLREENRLRLEYPEVAPQIIWWKNFIQKRRPDGSIYSFSGGGGGTIAMSVSIEEPRVVVDNADYILEQFLGCYVEKASITKEIISTRKKK